MTSSSISADHPVDVDHQVEGRTVGTAFLATVSARGDAVALRWRRAIQTKYVAEIEALYV